MYQNIFFFLSLSLSGTLKKAYFKSNGSETLVTDGEVPVSEIILTNPVCNKSTATSATHPSQHIPAWTTDASLPGDQNHRNASMSEGAEHSCLLMSVEPTGGWIFKCGSQWSLIHNHSLATQAKLHSLTWQT